MADKEDQEQEEQTIAQDLVVTKYKMTAEIVNGIMKQLMEKCKPEESVLALCELGDKLLAEETAKVYKKEKEMKKGIAFPTCISVNNTVCHFSPLKSDPDVIIADGDMVKIDLGAHIDGFIAVLAHTFVVGASKDNKITGRKADVMMAAHQAAEAALRLVKPGNENYQVTDTIQKVAESYECKPIEGMLSHQLKQHVIDGEKAVILNPNEAQRKEHEKCEFDVHEVYAVDVLISTGEGKGREQDSRTTIYKKMDNQYSLKMKNARKFYTDVDKKFSTMPFSLRMMDNEVKARMGLQECVAHQLVQPFNVLYERKGEFVAQFKFTMLLMPNGPMRITSVPLDLDIIETEKKVEDPDLQTLLATSVSRKAAKKKKKKAGKAMAEGGGPMAPEAATNAES